MNYRAREGLMFCMEVGCTSPLFKASTICSHINHEGILEEFINNLLHLQYLKTSVTYQEELTKLVQHNQNEKERERLNLIVLSKCLHLEMPNGKMCRNCKFGPVVLQGCSDLLAHNGESGISNSCPQCGWLGSSWDDWLEWDGGLPNALTKELDIPKSHVEIETIRNLQKSLDASQMQNNNLQNDIRQLRRQIGRLESNHNFINIEYNKLLELLMQYRITNGGSTSDCDLNSELMKMSQPNELTANRTSSWQSNTNRANRVPCRHFQKGFCRLGDRCKFQHSVCRFNQENVIDYSNTYS